MKLRRFFSILFVITAFGFLGVFVARSAAQLRDFSWDFRPGLIALSVLLNIAALVWGSWVWKLVLQHVGIRLPLRVVSRIWFLAALGRYIPGKIWQFVGAAHLGAAAGLAPVVTVTSLAVHTGLFLLGAVLTAVYCLPLSVGDVGGVGIPLLRWLAPLLVIGVHPAVIRRTLDLFHRLARRSVASWEAGWIDGIWLLLLAVIGWALNGVALFLFIAGLVPLADSALVPVVGINALAFLVGLAVFVAPAGLGAKEGALAALLTLVGPPLAVTALVAVAARLWTVLAEVTPALALLRGGRSGVTTGPESGSFPTPR